MASIILLILALVAGFGNVANAQDAWLYTTPAWDDTLQINRLALEYGFEIDSDDAPTISKFQVKIDGKSVGQITPPKVKFSKKKDLSWLENWGYSSDFDGGFIIKDIFQGTKKFEVVAFPKGGAATVVASYDVSITNALTYDNGYYTPNCATATDITRIYRVYPLYGTVIDVGVDELTVVVGDTITKTATISDCSGSPQSYCAYIIYTQAELESINGSTTLTFIFKGQTTVDVDAYFTWPCTMLMASESQMLRKSQYPRVRVK